MKKRVMAIAVSVIFLSASSLFAMGGGMMGGGGGSGVGAMMGGGSTSGVMGGYGSQNDPYQRGYNSHHGSGDQYDNRMGQGGTGYHHGDDSDNYHGSGHNHGDWSQQPQ